MSAPAQAADPTAAAGDLRLAAVYADGSPDWIDVANVSGHAVTLTGWDLTDDDPANDSHPIADGTVLTAGQTLTVEVGTGADPDFGLGKSGDSATLRLNGTTVDSVTWTAKSTAAGTAGFARCADDAAGDTTWTSATVTQAGAFTCPDAATVLTTAKNAIKVNEVVADNADGSDGKQRPDWIELANTGIVSADLTGWWLSDDDAADKDLLPAGTAIGPGGFAAYGVGGSKSTDLGGIAMPWGTSKTGTDFGLGADGDQAAVVAPDGTDADRVAWGTAAGAVVPAAATGDALARDATQTWVESTTPTPGQANTITAPSTGGDPGTGNPGTGSTGSADSITINEVSSDNATADQVAAGDPLSDAIELYNKGDDPVDLTGWKQIDSGDASAATTFGPIYVNGSTTPASDMTVPGHGYAVFSSTKGLSSGGDAVKLYTPDGTLVDSVTYGAGQAGVDETTNSDNTYKALAACPDGGDSYLMVKAYSFGTSNAVPCETGTPPPADGPTSDVPCTTEAPGPTTDPVTGAVTWPGSSAVAVADDQCAWDGGGTQQDLSGLVFDPTDPSTLWAVKNKSVVFKLAKNSDGVWQKVTTDGWADGKNLTFPGGTGLPDSEGMTVGPDGALYITTERDNANNDVPLDTILRFDPSQSGTTLTATDEWDLTADLGFAPSDSADANLGFEGVTYVPDSYLTTNGFIDDNTHTFYKPSTYSKKVTAGLFFAAVEKTGHLEAYALNSDHTFTRVADIGTGMAGVMDVSYDADLHRIWAQCDNTCGVDLTLLKIGSDGHFTPEKHYARPAGLPDNNLEGFAVAPVSTAVDGERETVWSDDGNFGTSTTGVSMTADNGGHSLWSGLMDVDLGLGPQGYQAPTKTGGGGTRPSGNPHPGGTIAPQPTPTSSKIKHDQAAIHATHQAIAKVKAKLHKAHKAHQAHRAKKLSHRLKHLKHKLKHLKHELRTTKAASAKDHRA